MDCGGGGVAEDVLKNATVGMKGTGGGELSLVTAV